MDISPRTIFINIGKSIKSTSPRESAHPRQRQSGGFAAKLEDVKLLTPVVVLDPAGEDRAGVTGF